MRITIVGQQKLSGKQEEIRFKISLSLCKHVDPATGSIRNRLKAYVEIAQELVELGVSPRYVGDIWRRHKDAIVDSLRQHLGRVAIHPTCSWGQQRTMKRGGLAPESSSY